MNFVDSWNPVDPESTGFLDLTYAGIALSFQEIPEDELELGKDEILVPVAHFNKVKVFCVYGKCKLLWFGFNLFISIQIELFSTECRKRSATALVLLYFAI